MAQRNDAEAADDAEQEQGGRAFICTRPSPAEPVVGGEPGGRHGHGQAQSVWGAYGVQAQCWSRTVMLDECGNPGSGIARADDEVWLAIG